MNTDKHIQKHDYYFLTGEFFVYQKDSLMLLNFAMYSDRSA